MTDASIPLQIQPVPVTPAATTLGQVMNMRHAQVQNQLAQADLQKAKLENDQAVRLAQTQDLMSTLMEQNHSVGDDGVVKFDYPKIQEGLARAGRGPEAAKLSPMIRAENEAALKLLQEKLKTGGEVAKRVADIYGAIPPVDYQEQDPAKRQMQTVSAMAAFANANQQVQKEGLPVPAAAGQVAAMLQQSGGMWTPQVQDFIQQTIKQGIGQVNAHNEAVADIKANQDKIIGPLDITKKKLENLKSEYELAGQEAPTIVGQQAWTEWRNKFSPEAQARIPEAWSPDAVQSVKQMALTANQEQTSTYRQQRQEDLEKEREFKNQILAENSRVTNLLKQSIIEQRLGRGSGNGKVDQETATQASRELDTALKAEPDLWGTRKKILTELGKADDPKQASLTNWIDDKGKAVPYSQAGMSLDAVKSGLEDKLETINKKLGDVTDQKYRAMGRLGMPAKIPVDQVHAAIENTGRKKVAENTTEGGGTVKSKLTEADVRAWAKKNSLDEDDAVKVAKDNHKL